MLGKNMRQNLPMVVQIATAYSDQIGAELLIEMMESFKLYEGLFYYLGAIVNNSTVSTALNFRTLPKGKCRGRFEACIRLGCSGLRD